MKFPFLTTESDEMLHLDLLRFYAACGIVFLHTQTFLEVAPAIRRTLDHTYLSLLVDLFFAISGFVISFVYTDRIGTGGDYLRFLQRRVARLVPLHWLMLFIFALIGALIRWKGFVVNHAEMYDFGCFRSSLFLFNAVGLCSHQSFNLPSWSIGAEMFMYVLFPAFLGILKFNRRGFWLLICLVLCALGVIRSSTPWYQWTFQNGVLRAVPSFLFGMVLYTHRSELKRLRCAPTLCWTALAVFLVGALQRWNGLLLIGLIYLIVAAAVAADAQRRTGFFLRCAAPLGKLTYSVYMIHQLVALFALNFILERFLKFHGAARNIFVLSVMLSVLPLAYLSYEVFETPFRRVLSKQWRFELWLTGRSRPVEKPYSS